MEEKTSALRHLWLRTARLWSSAMSGLSWLTRTLTWHPRLEFPPWRWARNFEWFSGARYQGRAVVLHNRPRTLDRMELGADRDRIQTAEFGPNRFKSSKYTVLTFPFLNLMEQFRRLHNLYFLVVSR